MLRHNQGTIFLISPIQSVIQVEGISLRRFRILGKYTLHQLRLPLLRKRIYLEQLQRRTHAERYIGLKVRCCGFEFPDPSPEPSEFSFIWARLRLQEPIIRQFARLEPVARGHGNRIDVMRKQQSTVRRHTANVQYLGYNPYIGRFWIEIIERVPINAIASSNRDIHYGRALVNARG